MPIQFLCPGCGQPIEVDEPHAGKSAACPYCQRVVSVPWQSTYQPERPPPAVPLPGGVAPPAARPAARDSESPRGPDWAGQVPPLPYRAVPPARVAAARRSGNVALVFIGLAILLGVLGQLLSPPLDEDKFRPPDTTGLTHEQRLKLQEQQLREGFEELRRRPGLVALNCSAPLLVCLGLALGIMSLAYAPRGNWRGMLATVVAALCITLVCAGVLYRVAMLGVPGGG